MRKIRKGDKVQVISGKDKGRNGIVMKVLTKPKRPETGLWVIVENINLKTEHQKANEQQNKAGGLIKREAAMPVCKVALIDPVNDKPSRVGIRLLQDGKKVRFYKSSGEVVDA